MKLILGSDYTFLLKYGYGLTGIPKNQMKIGYITTASKKARTHQQFFLDVKKTITENGYSLEEFDFEGKSENEIRKFFKDKNVIQVEGGNTFFLLKIIRETGFDKILKEFLKEGKVYIGASAGSYVMCPSVEVTNWHDETYDRFGMVNFTALGYVSFVLFAHYKDEKKEYVLENMKTLNYPLRILRDGEGFFCEDGKVKFIGDNEETVIR